MDAHHLVFWSGHGDPLDPAAVDLDTQAFDAQLGPPDHDVQFGSTWGDGALTDGDVIEARDGTGYTSPSDYVHGTDGYDKDPA